MRVFIFGAGRCGSVSWTTACQYASNYSAAHESKVRDWIYPDQHIEVNPQLRAVLPELVKQYPGSMCVWLRRDFDATVASFCRRPHWVDHWWGLAHKVRPVDFRESVRIAVAWLDTQSATTWARLDGPKMTVWLERWREDFPRFWSEIGAVGDLAAALRVFETPLNTSV